MSDIPWIEGSSLDFPHPSHAFQEPDGLLAAGGDLSCKQLIHAYRHGIFPWFDDSQPILWWSPNPRLIIKPQDLHISRSLRKTLRRDHFTVSSDTCFTEVMQACAEPRKGEDGTWITDDMLDAYAALHDDGYAHSVEIWSNQQLVGGLYGVAIGKVFFGESMFSRVANASKVAFALMITALAETGFELVDCQVQTDHLQSLGAHEMEREQFLDLLVDLTHAPNRWPTGEQWSAAQNHFMPTPKTNA